MRVVGTFRGMRGVMRSRTNIRSALFLSLAALHGFSLAGARSAPASVTGRADQEPIAFALEAQPLSRAVSRFMSLSGVSIVADSRILNNRRSAPLKGRYVPEDALRGLLVGTGLAIKKVGRNTFTLVAAEPVVRVPPAHLDYAAKIQNAVLTALCQTNDMSLLQYRTVFRIWLDQAGGVTRVELAGSTGSSQTDGLLLSILRRATVGEPPPQGLPQPIKLAILPGMNADAACAPKGGR